MTTSIDNLDYHRNNLVYLCGATIFKNQDLFDVEELKRSLPEELYCICFPDDAIRLVTNE